MPQIQTLSGKNITEGSYTWISPSNIALVKYWGKHGNQMPANPSLSFSLSKCFTQSTLEFIKKDKPGGLDIEVELDGMPSPSFKEKILTFFNKVINDLPIVTEYTFKLKTHNSFPHSSGIASSASGMSALVLCLITLEADTEGYEKGDEFYRRASYFARIASGSACRSVYGGLVEWGRHTEIPESHDMYAIPYPFEPHPVFNTYCDTILLIHEGAKSLSSSAGHELMNRHPFARQRFEEARTNLSKLVSVIRAGDVEEFGKIVEKEAMMLHALMMCSEPPYILMKPNTLASIEKIWQYRRKTKTPVHFTLDAGANVHVLYPATHKAEVEQFIAAELAGFCENKKYICDTVGNGPVFLG